MVVSNPEKIQTGLDFASTENQQMVAQMVRDFAEKHIRPHVMEWDEAQYFPIELRNSVA
jgi:alkylation response protein AidB-like acyl-CoA dehydrogenase